jgi:hypothetical protein
VKGSYSGLFLGSDEAGFTNSGWFTLNVTAHGNFAGRVIVSGKKYPLRGRFDESGSAQVILTRTGQTALVIGLSLDLSGGTDQMSGSVSDGTWSAMLDGERITRRTAVTVGKYSVVISAADNASALPGGNGSGTANVSVSGQIRFSAILGDGTHVSEIGKLTVHNHLPFYAPLYAGRGAIFGRIVFDPGSNTFDGTLTWSRPPIPGDIMYPDGFTTNAVVLGSR